MIHPFPYGLHFPMDLCSIVIIQAHVFGVKGIQGRRPDIVFPPGLILTTRPPGPKTS